MMSVAARPLQVRTRGATSTADFRRVRGAQIGLVTVMTAWTGVVMWWYRYWLVHALTAAVFGPRKLNQSQTAKQAKQPTENQQCNELQRLRCFSNLPISLQELAQTPLSCATGKSQLEV